MIVVDSREPREIAIEVALGAPKGEELVVREMSAGDILIERNNRRMLIERKTPSDLLSSLSDGRLFQQAMRMREECPRSLILITGHLYPTREGKVKVGGFTTGWNLWSVRMALLRIQLSGVAVLEIGERDLPEVIRHLFHYLEKKPVGVPPSAPDPLTPVSQEIWFLAQLPGIGVERARELMREYKSPYAAIDAILSGKASKVKGLGKRTVQKAKEFLT